MLRVDRHKRLFVTVHDVTPKHEARLKEIHAILQEFGIDDKYGMLVVPDFWGEWPLEAHPEFGYWLREKSDAGVEMILHGFCHRDAATYRVGITALKASVLTAHEGEFLNLDAEAASVRLRNGQGVLARVLGYLPKGFIAPAWLYGPGAHTALRTCGISFAEDHMKVWNPQTGAILSRSPVISFASRSFLRIWSSIIWSRLASILLYAARDVRVAIHPHDVDVPLLVAEIRRTLTVFLKNRKPARYSDFEADMVTSSS